MSVTNGPFVFSSKQTTGTSFSIAATAPEGYTCKPSDASGTVAASDASKTVIACAPVVLAGIVRILQQPVAVASDGNGNLYVADAGNDALMKLSPSGTWSVVAGGAARPGYVDGPGAAARFRLRADTDIVADAEGYLIVADVCNGLVRKVTSAGTVSTLAGRLFPCTNIPPEEQPGFVDGSGTAAVFDVPGQMVSDGAGGAVMIELANGGVVRRISASGDVTSMRYPPVMLEPGRIENLSFIAIARGADGTLYFADYWNRIWKDVDGKLVLLAGGQLGGGAIDGTGAAARFALISDMVAAPGGDLYVADLYAVRKVTPDGQVTTLAGDVEQRGTVDGQGPAARFRVAGRLALETNGLVVLDTEQGILRRVSYDGKVTTIAATPPVRSNRDGAGSAARINSIASLAADREGNLYFTDSSTHVVRKATPDGSVSTIAGQAGTSGRVDGPLATATLASPRAVAASRDGSLWVLQETGLRRIVNGSVSTVDPVLQGVSLTIDAEGNAIVVTGMRSYQVVRITPSGQKTVLISKEDVMKLTGDQNNWFGPQSVAVDAAGNIYAADTGTVAVYKLSTSGQLSVFAGTPLKETGDLDGPAGTATLGFYDVDYLTIDDAGNLYLSGQGGVRVISPAGVVSTPAFGWGQAYIGALAYAKGKLYGMTPYALLQTWLP